MKKLVILLGMIILFTSCTFRQYNLTFNYSVGNNGVTDLTSEEIYEREVAQAEGRYVEVPQGSGNLTIYIQADIPKHIETTAEGQMSIPFKMLP